MFRLVPLVVLSALVLGAGAAAASDEPDRDADEQRPCIATRSSSERAEAASEAAPDIRINVKYRVTGPALPALTMQQASGGSGSTTTSGSCTIRNGEIYCSSTD